MPKNPAKNIDRYKIDGGELNEFEFQKNQAAIAEEDERFRKQASKKATDEIPVASNTKAEKKPRKKAAR